MERFDRLFAQGARCGHLEARCNTEDPRTMKELASAASWANANPGRDRIYWKLGYECGFSLATSGEPLPDLYKNAELP